MSRSCKLCDRRASGRAQYCRPCRARLVYCRAWSCRRLFDPGTAGGRYCESCAALHYTSPHVEAPPPSVDPTLQERIARLCELAAAGRPLSG